MCLPLVGCSSDPGSVCIKQELMLKTNEPTSNLIEKTEILPITSKIQGKKMKRKLIVKKKIRTDLRLDMYKELVKKDENAKTVRVQWLKL